MQKLTLQETKDIQGGAISGALLNGIGKIIDASCKGMSTMLGTINNITHS